MYEFDEQRWDDQQADTDGWTDVREGWLIQKIGNGDAGGDPDRPVFLQIGTGQWCSARYATRFPRYSTAEVYAKEFGYVIDRQVQIIRRRF